jgi:hypothetical protein
MVMRRAVAVLSIFLVSACGGAMAHPPRSPLAQVSYDAEPPTLHVGDRHAVIIPYNRTYTTLLSGEARSIAERSHRSRLAGALLGLATTASAIAALVLVIKYEGDAFDLDEPQGKATVGLAVGSGLIGAVGGLFARRGRGGLHHAVNVYNAEVLARDFVPRAAVPVTPVSSPAEVAPPLPAPVAPGALGPAPAAPTPPVEPPPAAAPAPVVPPAGPFPATPAPAPR